jgi:hypothetical protein
MSFGVEGVVNLAVITDELLEHCDGFEALHGAFPSPNSGVNPHICCWIGLRRVAYLKRPIRETRHHKMAAYLL